MHIHNVIVIGAGPAGMMAAFRAAELTDDVALLEKNASLGRKLGLTGKGRCNITNTASLKEQMEKFGVNGMFLRDAFCRFFVQDLFRFFEARGLKLKTERQGRVFPSTDTSVSVVDALKKALTQAGVAIRLSSPIKRIGLRGDGIKHLLLNDGSQVFARKAILATGGVSYPQTGSTGDGYAMAAALGHKIETAIPGLVPLETEETLVKEVQGLTLKNVRIVFLAGSKRTESGVGELLFTHFGVSGPLVLDLSAEICRCLKKGRKVRMLIDLKPGLSGEQLDLKLQRELQVRGSLKAKNYLNKILPRRFADIVLSWTKIDAEKKCHQVTSQERRKILEALKRFPLSIKGARPISEAMVTCGGVSLREVDPRTMASEKAEGVYFCGEVLDLAAASGGFNLQAAFSTGYLAGESAALSLS